MLYGNGYPLVKKCTAHGTVVAGKMLNWSTVVRTVCICRNTTFAVLLGGFEFAAVVVVLIFASEMLQVLLFMRDDFCNFIRFEFLVLGRVNIIR